MQQSFLLFSVSEDANISNAKFTLKNYIYCINKLVTSLYVYYFLYF
jgi:hypothetical protein